MIETIDLTSQLKTRDWTLKISDSNLKNNSDNILSKEDIDLSSLNSKYKKIIVDSSTITEIKYSTTNSQNSKGFFSNLNNITEIGVNVPSLTTLSNSSFSSNGGLVKVNLSKTKITSIPNSAFKNCSGLTTLLLSTSSDNTTNNTITSIGSEAFSGTRKLSSLKFSHQ